MATQKQSQVSAALKSARAKRKKIAKKVEAAQAKLVKRTVKLRALESKIAHLEHAHASAAASSDQGGQVSADLRPATLIFNPTCGAVSKGKVSLEEVTALLRVHGIQADVKIKTSGKVARKLAKEAVVAKEKLVIVAGGDGTIEDIAAQLVGSTTTLGILPVGTRNNVARSLGIPLELKDACALLGVGNTRNIDVGHVRVDEKPEIKYFLETAGFGLTAIALPAGQAARKGRLNLLPHAVRKLFDHKPGPVQLVLDGGEPILATSQLVTVSNAPLMGLNFLVAPSAKMDDGLLDIAVYESMGKTNLLEYFMATRDGRQVDDPRVRRYRANKVRIQSQLAQPVHSDKEELAPQVILDIEVMPGALRVAVGNGIGLSSPVDAMQSLQQAAAAPPLPENGSTNAVDSEDADLSEA